MSARRGCSDGTTSSDVTITQSGRPYATSASGGILRVTAASRSLRYNKLSGMVKSLACKIKELDPKDPYRNEITTQLLEKL